MLPRLQHDCLQHLQWSETPPGGGPPCLMQSCGCHQLLKRQLAHHQTATCSAAAVPARAKAAAGSSHARYPRLVQAVCPSHSFKMMYASGCAWRYGCTCACTPQMRMYACVHVQLCTHIMICEYECPGARRHRNPSSEDYADALTCLLPGAAAAACILLASSSANCLTADLTSDISDSGCSACACEKSTGCGGCVSLIVAHKPGV